MAVVEVIGGEVDATKEACIDTDVILGDFLVCGIDGRCLKEGCVAPCGPTVLFVRPWIAYTAYLVRLLIVVPYIVAGEAVKVLDSP